MKRIILTGMLVAAAMLSACKKSEDKAKAGDNPTPGTSVVDGCSAMAAHMTELQSADLPKEMPDEQKTKIRGMMTKVTPAIAKSCNDTKWSAEAITCMTGIKAIAEAKGCESKLTPEQKDAVESAARNAAMEADKPSADESAAAMKGITDLKTEMCACKDAACGEAVYAKWGDVEKASEHARHDEATKTKWEAVDDELMKCKSALK